MSCPAYCCEAFHIPTEAVGWLWDDPEQVNDGPFLREMLIELDPIEAQRRHRESMGLAGWIPDEGEHYFTCKHWDTETRLCREYENRPAMCRDYPASGCACKHGCAYTQ